MARILAISSQVARGYVGLSIIVPALQALGHEVIGLPTVLLSNHPGHPHVAGTRIDPEVLQSMLDALTANGWLEGLDAILTGYLPTPGHVAFAARAVEHTERESRNGNFISLCDPVMGDDPHGLYIGADAAAAIRDTLVGKADVTTPNRFELSFLSQSDVTGAAHAFVKPSGAKITFATSIPSENAAEIVNIVNWPQTQSAVRKTLARVPSRANAPHGTGDLFSALILAALVDSKTPVEALAFATAGVDATLAGSIGRNELAVAALPARSNPGLVWPTEPAAS